MGNQPGCGLHQFASSGSKASNEAFRSSPRNGTLGSVALDVCELVGIRHIVRSSHLLRYPRRVQKSAWAFVQIRPRRIAGRRRDHGKAVRKPDAGPRVAWCSRRIIGTILASLDLGPR